MHVGIAAARRQVAPNSTRLSDWAQVTGVTSQGPSGLSGLLMKELPPPARKTTLPWILQYCRISKQWPAFMFHVVWEAIFVEMENISEASAIRKLQTQYFSWKADVELWDAPWRSAPDRIMPGTDAGSAPQESWHGSELKPAFEQIRRKPAAVAKILEEQIAKPQLRVLQEMRQEQKPFQDWPAIGQFLDQNILSGDVQLRKPQNPCWPGASINGGKTKSATLGFLLPPPDTKLIGVHPQARKKRVQRPCARIIAA